MNRRRLFGAATLVGGALLTMLRASRADAPPKVVYHLTDIERVDAVLGNIRHHYEGAPTTKIALVVHGPALRAFVGGDSAALRGKLARLVQRGLQPVACANTLDGMGMTLADLADGFTLADRGGVVRLAEMQRDGYAYLRP